MQKKILYFLIVSFFVFSSCRSTSPFLKGGKTKLLKFFGKEGDVVVCMDMHKERELFCDILSIDDSSVLSRIKKAIFIHDGNDLSLILEGNIPLIATNIITNNLDAVIVEKDGEKFYRVLADKDIIYFNLVYPGVVLVSLSQDSYINVLRRIKDEKKTYMPVGMDDVLQDSSIGMYAFKPHIGVLHVFKENFIDGAFLFIDKMNGKYYNLNGVIKFRDKQSFSKANILMKSEYVADVVTSGQKSDVLYMRNSFISSLNDMTLTYKDLEITKNLLMKFIALI